MNAETVNEQKYLVFSTFNIAEAKREEAFEETRFDVRWPAIKELIKECNADILCLQELRNLATSAIDVPRLLYEVAQLGYDYKHAYYGATPFSFALATFYRRDKFFVAACSVIQLPAKERIMLDVTLRKLDDQRDFHVCNTHFGMEEGEKTLCAHFLASYLEELKPAPFLCAGDYNFFDDRDGQKQRYTLMKVGYDMLYPLTNASGTFMGFAHDDYKKPYEAMSRLDHVFVYGVGKQLGTAASVVGDLEKVKARSYPSDHLMTRFEFVLAPPDYYTPIDQ